MMAGALDLTARWLIRRQYISGWMSDADISLMHRLLCCLPLANDVAEGCVSVVRMALHAQVPITFLDTGIVEMRLAARFGG